MKITPFAFLFSFVCVMNATGHDKNFQKLNAGADLISVSQQLLLAAKTKDSTDSLVNLLENIPADELIKSLHSDDLKKAFWINLYNAFTQILLSKQPEKYKKRSSFFGSKQIRIAGENLSLDDIEHGILRRSKIKWSEGYLDKLFPSEFEKDNRVSRVDYRVHFSLNCGAKSCPPIAFYDPGKLDRQLDLATKTYLKGEVQYDSTNNSIALPAIMGWFRRDFGGKKKMRILLKKLSIVPADKDPAIHFKKYDWNLFLENYKSEQT